MAPTMQVACKAFIVPNPAARRNAPSETTDKMDASHLLELLPKCDILVADFTYALASGIRKKTGGATSANSIP